MLICNQVNYITCDPECPHVKPHEPIYDLYMLADSEYAEGYCDDYLSPCWFREDGTHARCVEGK